MKKHLFLSMVCSCLICCQYSGEEESTEEKPEEYPDELICSCGDEWPQDEVKCDRVLPWTYPIIPFSEEWEQLSTQERIDVCQIPEDVLSSLSTADLTEICMQYPHLTFDVLFWKPCDKGIDTLFYNFNGIRELFRREDMLKELMSRYKCDIQNLSFIYSDASDYERGKFTSTTYVIELLLTRYRSSDANLNNYMEIIQHLYCGYEKKLMHPDYFMSYSLGINLFSRAKIFITINEQNLMTIPQVGDFMDTFDIIYWGKWINGLPYSVSDAFSDVRFRTVIDELSCKLAN